MARLLPGMDACIAGLDVLDQAALAAADRLKVIARYGVGLDRVDLPAARQKGIVVTYTPGANSVSVAELAIGLMLSLARQIPAASQAASRGEWPRYIGFTLEGRTIGLIGLGAIGRHVAQRLSGFECHILAYDVQPDAAFAQKQGIVLTSIDDLLAQSDLVSLHLPLLPETRQVVNASFIAKMKPGAYLVNTARGELIDEDALLEALKSGQLRGVALDCFQEEPPAPNHPLLALPQVIATPHMGAHSDGATNAMGTMALRDCLAVLRGEEPRYRVV
ncbi:MAG: phosphoglycerate dehydrogenase [Chloroflexi bacterium]|nr:phosphoglycerate dehydrogenase [Chloroflexota bacterium]